MDSPQKKEHIVQFRMTDDEHSHLESAWAHYQHDNSDPVSLSEFIRRMIKNACAQELGMLEKNK